MINTQRYFIHLDNKSVVPWTSEIEGNYKFKEITLKIAMAIENGKISADEVVAQIARQMQIKPATLEQMLDAKLKMNVREGELNLEAQVKADNTQKDTGEAKPFDINVPGDEPAGDKPEGDKPTKTDKPADKPNKPTSRRNSNKPADKPTEKQGEQTEDAPADAAAKVAAALEGDGGAGGVNV